MRLSRGDQVAGLPGVDARKLMRRFGDAQPESGIGYWIDIGGRTGTEVARAFADAGYLRAAHVLDGETYWETTIKGNALAQASFGRPITRATAERHLAGVIDRAKIFNADGSHLLDALLWPAGERGAADAEKPVGVHQHHPRERPDPDRPVGGRLPL